MTAPLVIATDGSWLPHSSREGGWAWVVNTRYWGAGALADTTIGAMELTAVNEALRALLTLPPAAARPVRVLSDSQYVVQSANDWVTAWERRGWKTKKGPDVKNQPLWEQYLNLSRALTSRGWTVTCHWVRGHSGHAYNTLADQRAGEAARQLQHGEPVASGPGFTSDASAPLFTWPTTAAHPINGAPTTTIYHHPEGYWAADWNAPAGHTPKQSAPNNDRLRPTPDAIYLALLRLLRNHQEPTLTGSLNIVLPAQARAFFLPSMSRSPSLTTSARALAHELITEMQRHMITSWHLSRRKHG